MVGSSPLFCFMYVCALCIKVFVFVYCVTVHVCSCAADVYMVVCVTMASDFILKLSHNGVLCSPLTLVWIFATIKLAV